MIIDMLERSLFEVPTSLRRRRNFENVHIVFGKSHRHSLRELFEALVEKRGVWSAEGKDLILVTQTLKLSCVKDHMGKTFRAKPISKLLGRSSLAHPLGKGMSMKGVGGKRGTIKIEGPGFPNEEKVGIRWKMFFRKHGSLVVVDGSLGILFGRFLSKSDLLR